MTIKIGYIGADTLTKPLSLEILRLQNAVWPTEEDPDSQCNRFLARNITRPKRMMILLRDQETLIAGAEIFRPLR